MSDIKENGGLKQLEKNKYFYGKLMTVTDFEAEQKYFNDKIHLLNRTIHGSGIVFGLEILNVNIKDDKLSIIVSPGVALDCYGNEIVVGMENSGKEFEVEGTFQEDKDNYVYIRYNQCERELNSIVGDISTCEDSYCHNRIKETFILELGDATDPDIPDIKIIPYINRINVIPKIFNNFKDILDPLERIKEPKTIEKIKLHESLAQNYYNENLKSCPECQDPKVLLGVINKDGQVIHTDYREIVYNNPMLYDIISGHLSDYGNPHKITPEKIGALKSINGVSGDSNSDIKLKKGSNIEISEDNANKTINISTTAAVDSALLQLDTMSRYIRERALKGAVASFKELGRKFAPEQVGIDAINISNFAKAAVDNKSYKDESEFIKVINRKCFPLIDIKDSIIDLDKGEISDKLKDQFKDIGITLLDKANISKIADGFIISNRKEFSIVKADNDLNVYKPTEVSPLLLKMDVKVSEEKLNEGNMPIQMMTGLKNAGIFDKAIVSKVAVDKWVVSQGEDIIINPILPHPICINGLYYRGMNLVNELKSLIKKAILTKNIIGVTDFEKSLQELKTAIDSGNSLEMATSMDEVCFYASMIEVENIKPDIKIPDITVPQIPELNDSALEKAGIGSIRDVLKDTDSDSQLKKVVDIINLAGEKPGSTVKELADTLKMDETDVRNISDKLIENNVLKITDTKTNALDIKIEGVPDNIDNSVVGTLDIASLRDVVRKEDPESQTEMVNVINAVLKDTGNTSDIASTTKMDEGAVNTITNKLVDAGVIKLAGGRYRPL